MNKPSIAFLLAILVTGCAAPDAPSSTEQDAKPQPVNERVFIDLGGVKQYVEITGASDQAPVLLFLHGGPGWPQTPHLRYFNSALTEHMVLVSWDQAGCGRSLMNDTSLKDLSLDRMVRHAHELTLLLKRKFNKERIFLAGFSSGSIIGLRLIEAYPNDYEAYIGISQVVDIRRSFDLSLQWVKEQATKGNDKDVLRDVARLEAKDTAYCATPLDCFMMKYQMLTKYDGAVHSKAAATEIEKAEGFYEDYKGYDWFAGFMASARAMEEEAFTADLTGLTRVDVPVYFMIGRHDQNLPTSVTEDFVRNLEAPRKEIIWFEGSGHEPSSEEADKFNHALIDIVNPTDRTARPR